MATLYDLQKILNTAANKMPGDTLIVIEAEGLKFIAQNFEKQGFDSGSGTDKWTPRKTVDTTGRDITRYRTNRKGRAGTLNKYGRKNKGRDILVGHNTGGDKLKNSFDARRSGNSVTFYTYKPYAQRHNEGLKGMPKRQFMGKSPALEKLIGDKLKTIIDKRFK